MNLRRMKFNRQNTARLIVATAAIITAASAVIILLLYDAGQTDTDGTSSAIRDGNPSLPGETCPGGGYNPEPVAVAVNDVPIVVSSTAKDYFVLYARIDADGVIVEMPVLVRMGEAGTTELAENVEALPRENYRVEKYLVRDPADVDGDCTDDVTELGNPAGMNPLNSAAPIAFENGRVILSDRATFDTLAVEFGGRSYIHFVMFDMETDHPGIYFENHRKYVRHDDFMDDIGLDRSRGIVVGTIHHDADAADPKGQPGVLYYSTSNYEHPLSNAVRTHLLVTSNIPLAGHNFAWYIKNHQLPVIQEHLPALGESRIKLLFNDDVYRTDFLPLNQGVGYGLLRALEPGDRPNPRDVALYETLPNELPHVAGIITAVHQTPLSHVNLRAIQDGSPNAFIRGAMDDPNISRLIGSHVRYEVTDRWSIRAATRAEVEARHAASRPGAAQTPERDLSVTRITPLGEISFEDRDAFGVKAANLAVLRKMGFPKGAVPDGFAIPFHFYDEFMKHNGLYTRIETMLADPGFQEDYNMQENRLGDLRDAIREAETPSWMLTELARMNESFPDGINRRYRSSSNSEDLPGFNGAGLYDSKSQRPSEDEEDGLDKSLKEVYASLWNFRAFTERGFNRIDHLKAAMGILVHPSYRDELVNGVAVSFDPIHNNGDAHYVNSQAGEDLVTNPGSHSIPEEFLMSPGRSRKVLHTSNQVEPGRLLIGDQHAEQLQWSLEVIHRRFKALYRPDEGEPFAMEIEFKITAENTLAIKQARPWVFGGD